MYSQNFGQGPIQSTNTLVRRQPKWERALDVLLSLIALVLVSPLVLIVALLIKLVSHGPIIFKQERIGFNGKPFLIYKFRTMEVNTDETVHINHVKALIKQDLPMGKLDRTGDSRLIPFGRFLRASGIDELPQFLNVLKREMSLSGPRPCLKSEQQALTPEQHCRFEILPGLTGLWQVSGKNKVSFSEMVALDIKYANEKALCLYLAILLKTPFVILHQIADLRHSVEIAKMPLVEGKLKSPDRNQNIPLGQA
ncbi:sugar transferase [Opitutaceae bacterium]|nr:sugar transferase [Opitutaceae bacterium]